MSAQLRYFIRHKAIVGTAHALTELARLLVRADARQQELSVRAALGVGRARIAWELLLESLCLGLLGGLLGVGIAYEGLKILAAIGPANLPRLGEISLDIRSLVFTLTLSVLSGLLFGSIPALRYARGRTGTALRGAGRTASLSRERQRSRDLLVVAQVAMALVLLVSAVLMIRTFQALRHVEPGSLGRSIYRRCAFRFPRPWSSTRNRSRGPKTALPTSWPQFRASRRWASRARRRWMESNPSGIR